MNIHEPTSLLGGLSPSQFMRQHWQKRPLVVRGAVTTQDYSLTVKALLGYASREDMQSRYISQVSGKWILQQGPFQSRSKLFATKSNPWAVLVQGMDHHDDAMARLIKRFRFVPDARLDDVMVSYATPGGGVGPHVDSYDVFLLQLQGTRRWRIGPLKTAKSRELIEGAPIKLLRHFKPTASYDLAPGDMLYLPPGYGHDGVALDECLTASVGFRAPRAGELLASLLEQLADVVREADEGSFARLYSDSAQAATATPALLPVNLNDFLQQAWQQVKPSKADFEQIMGQYLSEPKPHVSFDTGTGKSIRSAKSGVKLARASIMLYGKLGVYLNGELRMWDEFEPGDREWLKQLANTREADTKQLRAASTALKEALDEWLASGYLVTEANS